MDEKTNLSKKEYILKKIDVLLSLVDEIYKFGEPIGIFPPHFLAIHDIRDKLIKDDIMTLDDIVILNRYFAEAQAIKKEFLNTKTLLSYDEIVKINVKTYLNSTHPDRRKNAIQYIQHNYISFSGNFLTSDEAIKYIETVEAEHKTNV